jgi:deazaflavin-dependent oxidoreductase (nitroreductase family)
MELDDLPRRRWWHSIIHRISGSRPGAALFARLLHHLDRPLLHLSKGRFSLASVSSGIPTVMLTTIGAKTGHLRSVPLVGIRHRSTIGLIASNWGGKGHPAWYLNLRAHPHAQLLIDGHQRSYVAHEATGDERAVYWRKAIALYPAYAAYEQRTSGRTIPVMVLSPTEQ